MTPQELEWIAKQHRGRPQGNGWNCHCPNHDDKNRSLSLSLGKGGKLLAKCFSGCAFAQIVKHFPKSDSGAGAAQSPKTPATAQPSKEPAQESTGLTLEAYADAKKLPRKFLLGLGCAEITYAGKPAVKIPYYDVGGAETAVRFRVALAGDKFRWRKNAKLSLYGLQDLDGIRKAGEVFVVEGESDCQTLRYHSIPALGVPGAGNWNDKRDAPHLDGIENVYFVVEPDKGGETILKLLADSPIRHRTKLMFLSKDAKDASALHLKDPEEFKAAWSIAKMAALPWQAHHEQQRSNEESEAWLACEKIAQSENILGAVTKMLYRAGVVGEKNLRQLLYLAITTRLLERPVSLLVKGPSSGGKSFLVEQVAKAFPATATYPLTAMSERALAYGDEPLSHRMLVIYEAMGARQEFTSYLVRSLLSEGKLIYETVEKTHDGLKPKRIEREGPTGLIMTTTGAHIHPENETRMLSAVVTDTQKQTKSIMNAQAATNRATVDWSPWHALQVWMSLRPCKVVVPYATELSELIPPIAVRLRRDFRALLTLICAHALLHQCRRKQTTNGAIIATMDDYAAVRPLVADIFAQGVEATVPPTIRETVETVKELQDSDSVQGVSLAEIAKHLKLDKSSVSRRARVAATLGYVQNTQTRKGLPAKYVTDDPLPDEIELLPSVEQLVKEMKHAR